MIHKNLSLSILLLIFLPMLAWGEDKTIDLSLPEYLNGFTIENDGTYTFTGTYPSNGTPGQDIGFGTRKAVINVATGKEVTIILEDVNISLENNNQCPLSARNAKKVTVQLKGENTLSIINKKGECPGLWAPEEDDNELIIKNGEIGGVLGVLNVQGAQSWPGIGVTRSGKGKITINGGYITAKGDAGGAGIGSSNGAIREGSAPNSACGYKGVITINNGIISAIGGDDAAGIGGGSEEYNSRNYNESEGVIIIKGGSVKAMGGLGASGIGGGLAGFIGSIIIENGIINATGGEVGGGIGGGGYNPKGTIINISGGIVNATGGDLGAGIGGGCADFGGGSDGIGGTITITGGTVNTVGKYGAGIGNGDSGSGATFSTGTKGNAFINASSINANTNEKDWQGIIFKANSGSIYGSPILSTDAIIPARKTLTIKSAETLTMNNGITLVNLGTIDNNSGGTITNNGTILNVASGNIKGTLSGNTAKTGYAVTCNLNYTNAPDNEIKYIESGESLNYSPARKNYTFDGWFDTNTNGNKVTTINQDIIVYAYWNLKDFTTKSNVILTADYGSEYNHTFSASELSDDISTVGGLKGIELETDNSLPCGLTLSGLTITGTPTVANENGKMVTFIVTANNNSKKNIEITFKVNKAKLTVVSNNKTITKVYDGNNTVTTPDVLKLEGVVNKDDVSLNDYTLTYDNENVGEGKTINIPGLSLNGTTMDNYSLTQSNGFSLTGAITQKELIVTPRADQKLYDKEEVKYDVTGAVTNENPTFTGTLGVKNGKVINNDLSLTDHFKKNYSLIITPDVDIVLVNEETVPILVKLVGTTDKNGAYKDNVTIMAPEGFEIALINVTMLKAAPSFDNSFNWNKPGKYRLTYQLKRNSDRTISSLFNIEVTIVTSSPVDPDPVPTPDPTPTIYYTVTLPAIEGATTDPSAGSYEVGSWSAFSFALTVDEGYCAQSIPVVKANGTVITPDNYGKYTVKYVRSDTNIEIEGIVKDNPVANEWIDAGIDIRTGANTIYVTVPRLMRLQLIDISGRVIRRLELLPGENRLEDIASGIYLLVLEGVGTEKVIVK